MKKTRLSVVLLIVATMALALMLTSCSFLFGTGNDNQSEPTTYYLRFAGEYINVSGGTTIEPISLNTTVPSESELVKPVHRGYNFDGWYVDKKFTQTYGEYLKSHTVGNRVEISKDIVVYAKWTRIGNTVIVSTNLAEAGKISVNFDEAKEEWEAAYDLNAQITLQIVDVDEHYEFLGWFVFEEEDKANEVSVAATTATFNYTVEDIDAVYIEARFEGKDINVYFYSNFEGADPVYVTQIVKYGESFTYKSQITRTDYGIVGWYDNADCEGSPVAGSNGKFIAFKPDSTTVSFYAKWMEWSLIEADGVRCMSYGTDEAVVFGFREESIIGDTVYIPRVWHDRAVTHIQDGAFDGLTKARIVIPSSVKEIEIGAFKGTSAALYFDNGADMHMIDKIAGKSIYAHVSNDLSGLGVNADKITARYAEAEGIFADTDIDGREEFRALFSYVWLYTVTGVEFNFGSCFANATEMKNGVINNSDAWVKSVTSRLALKTNTESSYGYTASGLSITFNFTERPEPAPGDESSDTRVARNKTNGPDCQTQSTSVHAAVSGGADHVFPIDSRPYYTVFNSEQLVYAVEHGYQPYFPEDGTSAEICYEAARTALRAIIKDGDDDIVKLTAIHDYICTNVIYDTELLELSATYDADDLNGYRGFNLEGVFIDKRSVCDGIAKSFMLMARIEGIEAIRISGKKETDKLDENGDPIKIGHAWNKVKVNGAWCAVDVTGDDPIVNMGGGTVLELLKHDLFLITDAALGNLGYSEDEDCDYPAANTSLNTNYYTNTKYYGKTLKVTSNADLNYMLEKVKQNAQSGKYYTLEILWAGSATPSISVSGSWSNTKQDNYYTFIFKK